jgi:hypothetical protein
MTTKLLLCNKLPPPDQAPDAKHPDLPRRISAPTPRPDAQEAVIEPNPPRPPVMILAVLVEEDQVPVVVVAGVVVVDEG